MQIAETVLNEVDMQKYYRENIIRALQQTEGRISGRYGAAALLGLNPSTLNSRIKRLKIQTYKKVMT